MVAVANAVLAANSNRTTPWNNPEEPHNRNDMNSYTYMNSYSYTYMNSYDDTSYKWWRLRSTPTST